MSAYALTVADDAGCWFDSHHGFEAIAKEAIRAALRCGMPDPDTEGIRYADIAIWDGVEVAGGIMADDLAFAVEAAEMYLSTLAPAGYWVGWYDGDFGMYPIESEEA